MNGLRRIVVRMAISPSGFIQREKWERKMKLSLEISARHSWLVSALLDFVDHRHRTSLVGVNVEIVADRIRLADILPRPWGSLRVFVVVREFLVAQAFQLVIRSCREISRRNEWPVGLSPLGYGTSACLRSRDISDLPVWSLHLEWDECHEFD